MRAVYLDHAAATPMRPEVREALEPFLGGLVGNPSSVHRWGQDARRVLEEARERTAALLRVAASEVKFVRGGTESINLAILGRHRTGPRRSADLFLRSAVEHSAVRESMAALSARGAQVEPIPVDAKGRAKLPPASDLAHRGARLVSCQWVNHETGMVLPIAEIAEACAEAGVPLHVDAVQAAGRVPLPLDTVPITLLSLSGHKLGGPRGSGVLVVRKESELTPVLFGGGQEDGLRPGTEDIAGAVGFTRALEISVGQLDQETHRLEAMRAHLESRLADALPDLLICGGEAPRAPHILGLGFRNLPRDVLPGALDLEGVAVSAGSACRSGSSEVSPVLEALYGEDARQMAQLRLSLGWSTTWDEVQEAAEIVSEIVGRISSLEVC